MNIKGIQILGKNIKRGKLIINKIIWFPRTRRLEFSDCKESTQDNTFKKTHPKAHHNEVSEHQK